MLPLPPHRIISLSILAVGITYAFGPCNLHSFAPSSSSSSSPLSRHHSSPSPALRFYCDGSRSTSRHSSTERAGYRTTHWNLFFFIDSHSTIMYASNDIDESMIQLQLQQLALWVIAFASSHIGMSAIRSSIISFLGQGAQSLNLVNNEEWGLPSWWPGDSLGGNYIFPDALTAGRQMYRAIYSAVSFVTLGSAFGTYLDVASIQQPTESIVGTTLYETCLVSAALSYGAVTASLFNASPLGLMPGFGVTAKNNDGKVDNIVNTIQRDDTLKLEAYGLTRITRHPLILPVVPWGLANSILAGGRACDYILFGGLSIYAIAGCFAQDLRVMREEGSVGTVFRIESREDEHGEREQLRSFFETTSFIPFQAVVDGRQRIGDIIVEVPWLQFFVGTVAGVYFEERFLQLLREWTVGL